MLGVLVFVASFLFPFCVTLIVPNMPPGQIICAVFYSETNYSIAEISGEVLVNGIVNGLIWGIIIVILYAYWKGPQKGRVNLPVWVPRYTTSHTSAAEHKPSKQYDESSFHRVRKTKTQPLDSIEGIGHIYGYRLRKLDIKSADDLLVMGYTRNGRYYLAKKIGVSPSLILKWVNQVESRT